MINKFKNIVLKIDQHLYKKFRSYKTVKVLENIKEAKIIFSHLNNIGEESKVRFVGGCVRKALSGEYIDDIDLATSLDPDRVKEILIKNSIKVIDTGLSHGTVTAIVNKKKFEITTLRKDISTDGRHAKVEFTQKWKEDALRRDFTINAIYSDIEGRIFDPLNGTLDLKNQEIKFIGSAEERIQEDYLRILRYIRFFIQYSKTSCNKNDIQSIKRNINGLNKVANERIFEELKKILSLKNLHNLFSNENLREIILNIFPQFRYHERLKLISSIEKDLRFKYDVYLILAIIIVDQSNDYEYFCHKYKTSNKIKKRFKNISKNYESLKMKNFYLKNNIKKLIYLSSKDDVIDLLLISIFINKKVESVEIEHLIDYVKKCEVPKFPISGDILKNNGYETGYQLGAKLKLLEEKWIENNFTLDKETIENFLGKSFNN